MQILKFLLFNFIRIFSLQYRYMQLIENVNPDDDAPVDNVCGTGLDDEDDDEEIDMKKQSKAKKFMNVVKKALKKV
ncbi:unnamed protein product [Didymodactylos carnosus]|uniref:Uncharacterized protein n=1 Tax=Didymodactylos carnosus TaxID=1234261 RepID=A0A8S2PMH9_9BILA|nr:unnamed protein product [Didymodactylos carnosus]CAF4053765.1 unnamed protein product [Didymodactylos carnosus]